MPLIYMTPPGWKKTFPDQTNGMYSIMHGKSGIVFTAATDRNLPPEPRDSRHLAWAASRFASAWKLPLQQWATQRQWQVYEADRKHPKRDTRVISGTSDRYDFEVIAFLYDPVTAADIDTALDSLFATTTDAAGNIVFRELVATNVAKKPIAPIVSDSQWTVGRQTIRIPAGWVSDDTTFPIPPSFEPELALPKLSLGRIDGPFNSINVQWLQSTQLSQPNGRHRAEGWNKQAERRKRDPGTTLVPQQHVTPLTESFEGFANKTLTGAGGNAISLHWYYRSKRLALSAFGSAPNPQSFVLHASALRDIIRQLE